MALQLLVGGTDYTAYLEQATWRISQQLSRQGTTLTCRLIAETNAVSVSETAEVKLTDTALGQVLFDGAVLAYSVRIPGPNRFEWELSCVDWTYLLDARRVAGKYLGQTADAIIKNLLAAYPCGITGNHVQPGPVIPVAVIHHQSFSQALTHITQLASVGSSKIWQWYVDAARDLHFFDQATAPLSPYYLTDDLSDASPYAAHYLRDISGGGGFALTVDATTLRTQVYVRGGTYLSNVFTDTWVGNGVQKAFPISYPPDTIDYVPSLTIGGMSYVWNGTGANSFALDTGSSGQTATWLISPNQVGSYVLTINPWLQNQPSPPGSGVQISLSYKFQLPVQVIAQHPGAVSQYAGNPNGGLFDLVIEDPNILDINTAIQRAQRELAAYAFAETRVQVQTTEDFAGHFDAGQLVQLRNAQLGINNQFLIVGNTIEGRPGTYRTYTLTLVQVS